MKSFFYGVTVFLLTLAGFNPANAQPKGMATLESICAPWDGSAIHLVYDLPGLGRHLDVRIWGKGLEAVRAGKTFTIDNIESRNGTGRAQVVEEKRVVGDSSLTMPIALRIDPPADGKYMEQGQKWTMSYVVSPASEHLMIYNFSPVVSLTRRVCG